MEDRILNIIIALRLASGANAKKRVLELHKDNQEWKDYLVKVYNPFITYGVSGDKNDHQDDLDNLILCRSINAGVTAVTINKVYPGLIPTAGKMMKALDVSEYAKGHSKMNQLVYPLWAGIKYDGNYTVIIKDEDGVRYFTSGGHEYTVHMNSPKLPRDGVYLAERISGDGGLGTRTGCALKGSKANGNIQFSVGHTFKIFDFLTHEEFEAGVSFTPYYQRRDALLGLGSLASEWLVMNETEMYAMLKQVVSQGYEGLVLKSPDMIWRDSRSRRIDFCKIKDRPTADLLCVDEIEGDGKYAGLIGSLLLKNSSGVQVYVGSGLTDADRANWGSFKGRVIEIKYEQFLDTYIQPTFQCVRDDKLPNDID